MRSIRQSPVVVVILVGLLTLSAGVPATGGTDSSTTDWPTYGADSANTNANPSGTGPAEDLERAWVTTVGGEDRTSGVVVADGIAYTSKAGGTVAAVRRNGSAIWQRTVSTSSGPVTIEGAPAVSDGRVFVAGSDGEAAYLFALDATDGSQDWSVEIGASTESSPTVSDGVVYVGSVQSSSTLGIAEPDGPLTAVWINGTVKWTATDLDGEVATAPAVSDGAVYAGTVAGSVYKLNASTGAFVWRANQGNRITTAPTVAGGSVYVGNTKSNVIRIDAQNTDDWNYTTLDGTVTGSVAVVGDKVYATTEKGTLYALDAPTLATRNSVSVGNQTRHAPNVVGDTVYVTSESNIHTYEYDLSHLDSFQTSGTVGTSVVASDGQAFVGSGAGLVCVTSPTFTPEGCAVLPPDASLTANRTTVQPGDPIEFDASGSSDDGSVQSYAFDFDGDGTADTEGSGAVAVHSYGESGNYTATVTVTDDDGQTATATVNVSVQPDSPPEASLTANRTNVTAGDPIEFDASGSSDDGSVQSYAFDFDGDGSDDASGSNATVVHSYGESGNYTATVTVTDDGGQTNTASLNVTVREQSSNTSGDETGDDTGDSSGDNTGDNSDDSTDDNSGDTTDGDGGASSGSGGSGADTDTGTSTPTPRSTSTATATPERPTADGERYEVAVENGVVTFDGGPVEQIVFQREVAGNVTVDELSSLPDEVGAPPESLVTAMRIQVPADAESVDATVRIPISSSALQEAGVAPENAQVYRWHDGAWQPLETRTVAQGDGRVVLAADTPGFSIFAVASQSETPTSTPSPSSTERPSRSTPDSATAADDGAPLLLSGGGALGLLLLVALVVLLLGTVAYWRLRFDENVLEPDG